MTRYIISDTHLSHSSIREYCNRPFDTVEEMDERMMTDWNNIVDEDDAVIHLGDVTYGSSTQSTGHYLRQLNGNILLVRGNHDNDVPQNPRGYNVVNTATINHGRFTFYLAHHPEADTKFWQLSGHIHDNNIRDHPFINWENKVVNLSVELINYAPLALDELIRILDERKRYNTLQQARDNIGL